MKRLAFTVLPVLLLAIVAFAVIVGTRSEAAKDYVAAYAPEQPIQFSHKVHAGDNKIDCQFCHSYARRSASSGVPPVATCMNCHKEAGGIPGRTMPEEVNKVRAAFAAGTPIEWVKVHDVPDFVYFSHRAHIRIGEELGKIGDKGFTCQNCHGPVQEMSVAVLRDFDSELNEVPLTMGWCLTCHKNKVDDTALLFKLKREAHTQGVGWESLIGKVEATPEDVRHMDLQVRDCWTCHK